MHVLEPKHDTLFKALMELGTVSVLQVNPMFDDVPMYAATPPPLTTLKPVIAHPSRLAHDTEFSTATLPGTVLTTFHVAPPLVVSMSI